MINLTRNEYRNLRENGIKANEGYLFRNPSNLEKMIKVISGYSDIPQYLDIKMYTIQVLLRNRDILRELNISIPEDEVRVEMIPRGFQGAFIEGKSLETVLGNYRIPLDIRIGYLKQIGYLLRKMDEIRKTTHLKNFYYNDMHEDNFIVNPQGIVYGIDADSCSIEDNIPIAGLYSSQLEFLAPKITKYQTCNKEYLFTTSVVPDENIDLYCYIVMILNFIYGKPLDNLTPDKLLEYLDFLEFYGCNQELLYILARIYDNNAENINPDYLLDYIKDIYQISNFYYDSTGKLRKVLR